MDFLITLTLLVTLAQAQPSGSPNSESTARNDAGIDFETGNMWDEMWEANQSSSVTDLPDFMSIPLVPIPISTTWIIPRPALPTKYGKEITESPEHGEDHPCNYEKFPKYPEFQPDRTGKRVSEIQCQAHMWKYKYEIKEAERKVNECIADAKSKNENFTSIYGGLPASPGDFPHMGAVGWRKKEVDKKNPYKFMCGSSLISTRYALTAAHCKSVGDDRLSVLANVTPVVVRFGNVYIEKFDENTTFRYTDIRIQDFITLDEYSPLLVYNDVALIHLRESVYVHSNLRPACLWTGELDQGPLNITGWGQTEKSRGDNSAHLLYATVDKISSTSCNDSFAAKISRKYMGIAGHQFCAGKIGGHIDTCLGDSGGPIQIQREMPSYLNEPGVVYYILGVTSFGYGCGYKGKPGVYVSTSDHNILCWIERTVWPDETNDMCKNTTSFKGYHFEKKTK